MSKCWNCGCTKEQHREKDGICPPIVRRGLPRNIDSMFAVWANNPDIYWQCGVGTFYKEIDDDAE